MTDEKQKTPRELAEDDARMFGSGFTRRHPDGRVEHIPPDQVTIHGNSIHVKDAEPHPNEAASAERGIPVYSRDPQTQAEIEYFFDPDGDGDD